MDRRELEAGRYFFDIGANVGAYSLIAAKINGKDSRVYAFEPCFSTYAQLCRNIMLNGCEDTVIPLNVVLSDRNGIGWFNYLSLNTGESCHAFGEPLDYLGKEFKPACRQLLLSHTLDDYFKYLEVPALLKIDVDGIEFEILKGAEKMLSDERVRTILVEVVERSKSSKAIVDYLKGKGFNLISKNIYDYGESSTSNYIFSRP